MFYGHGFVVLYINTERALLFSSNKPPEAETHQLLSTEGWKCPISLLAVPSATVPSGVKSSLWPSPAAHKHRLFGGQSRGISCSCIRAAQGLSAFTKVPLNVKHECLLLVAVCGQTRLLASRGSRPRPCATQPCLNIVMRMPQREGLGVVCKLQIKTGSSHGSELSAPPAGFPPLPAVDLQTHHAAIKQLLPKAPYNSRGTGLF